MMQMVLEGAVKKGTRHQAEGVTVEVTKNRHRSIPLLDTRRHGNGNEELGGTGLWEREREREKEREKEKERERKREGKREGGWWLVAWAYTFYPFIPPSIYPFSHSPSISLFLCLMFRWWVGLPVTL